MQKKFILLLNLFLVFLLTGCIRDIKIPIGKLPTKAFEVSEYIQNDAIFQASSKLTLTGVSEEGVVIVTSLYDNKNNIVFESYCTTDENGKWELSFNTPEASMKSYTLKIKDSNEIYHQTFNDIRFGETWLIIGDTFNNYQDNAKTQKSLISYNKMFYYENKWVPATLELSMFGVEFLEIISSNQKSWSQYPLAIVFATADNTNIYEWISHELIVSRSNIKDFIQSENINLEENSVNRYDASNLYNKFYSEIDKMSYANIILNHGSKDLADYNLKDKYQNNDFRNMFSMLVYSFMSELINKINFSNNVYFIQDSLSFDNYANILRKIQFNITSYFNKVEIIPTYDLCIFYDTIEQINIDSIDVTEENFENLELIGYDYVQLANRIFNFDYKNFSAPCLDHVVQEYDNENNLTSIKLIFDNVEFFSKIKEIVGLKFYDQNNSLLDVNYSIANNEIIIYLELVIENEDLVENEESDINNVTIAYITYGFDKILYNNNLFYLGIPVIPFDVTIK